MDKMITECYAQVMAKQDKLAIRLANALARKDMSQKQLAHHLSLSPTTIHLFLAKGKKIQFKTLCKFIEFCDEVLGKEVPDNT